MTTTVLRQTDGCRVRVRSTSPTQVKMRGTGRKIIHVSAGISPIRSA